MKTLDFSTLRKSFSLLKEEDIEFLNFFFQKEEIQQHLDRIEKKRKKFWIWLQAYFIVCLFVFFFFDIEVVYYFVLGGLLLFYVLKKNFKSSLKQDVLEYFVKEMQLNLEYDAGGSLFPIGLNHIAHHTDIINPYDRLDFKEDSIKIEDKEKGFEIIGTEFKTSKRSTDSNGKTKYTTNNHDFILKVKFLNPKKIIRSAITLRPNAYQNPYLIIGCVFFLVIGATIWASMYDPLFIVYGLIIGIILLTVLFSIKSKTTQRVKLENIDFEKEFDIYSENQIESRQILTPAFMYRIYDYVNAIDSKRLYSFYFKEDYMYIKHNITSDFLEISFHKSLFQNLKDYVKFYLEIKHLDNLASDLKIELYDRDYSKKHIIK